MSSTQGVTDRRTAVTDTSVLINFLNIERLDLLCVHSGYRIVITEHVRGEVLLDAQVTALDQALEAGDIEEVALTDPEAQALFAQLNQVLGRGESAAIALAASRGWAIGMDEKGRARQEVRNRLREDRLLTTPGVLLRCIQRGVLTVEEADDIKSRLAEKRFEMNFDSFADLLS